MTDPDTCPPWCRRGPHASDPWTLRREGNVLTMRLEHLPGDPAYLAITVSVGRAAGPTARFPLPCIGLLAADVAEVDRESRRRSPHPLPHEPGPGASTSHHPDAHLALNQSSDMDPPAGRSLAQ